MNISSVLVNAQPQAVHDVQRRLLALHGIEIHVVSEDGRLIVTIEAESAQAAADTFSQINQQPGVLSASLVYHQFESDPDKEA
ncbi:MAG TPA: chaperone NapD [Accumulibacter sp.]|uniref:chaperone NapD n=1 Tax=Accumulibacter sp. TaxID=2053492 RepID=UPI002629C3F3|nr:chaperone NapD [Accumulibacter sp.]MDS4056080.1 chaperone NapD [Accumulibacter sp.]HMV06055.1 chaperone NapD [Accumulibacter sp.]HMW64139.1 chaperone NapD [Accumulibacter sp.]HMW78733.1 chaperone NapD [Accumulibacter sp.]HMX69090.1 chaperone NapD [Accumulibacter sp.]